PGLVGGHCIGVDPYYLTHKAQKIGHHPEIILAGRNTNDNVGKFVATSLVKQMIKKNMPIQGSKITILGFTFKENVPDIRNTRVIDIVKELEDSGDEVQVTDAYADSDETLKQYAINVSSYEELRLADAVVYAVTNEAYAHKGWDLIDDVL